MANALAIAAVTATLKDILNDGIVNGDLSDIGEIKVSSMPPDTLVGETEKNCINIYPWKITHNSALTSLDLPAYSGSGRKISRGRLCLNIHYILTSTGTTDLNGPIVMGFGMQKMHEYPVLNAALRKTLSTPSIGLDPAILPADYKMLVAADLADQIENVRLIPSRTEDEDLTNIWPAFNSALRLSSLYQVSVVMIENEKKPEQALPVRSVALKVNQLLRPRISFIQKQSGDANSIVETSTIGMGNRILITGSGLASDHMKVRIGETQITPEIDPADPAKDRAASTQISLRLIGDLRAGVNLVIVEHIFAPGDENSRTRESSNPDSIIILPDIQSVSVSPATDAALYTGVISITLTHKVGPKQSVELYMTPAAGSTGLAALSVKANKITSDQTEVTFSLNQVTLGEYLYRLDIDGAQTELEYNELSKSFTGP